MSNKEDAVNFIDTDEHKTIAVVDEEAYNISSDEVVTHESNGTVYVITTEDYYIGEYDEDGWLTFSEKIPKNIIDSLRENERRCADVESESFPIEFEVGYRSDNELYDTAWRQEILRPSSKEAKNLQNKITEVKLTIELSKDGCIHITDIRTWPDNSNVKIDICDN